MPAARRQAIKQGRDRVGTIGDDPDGAGRWQEGGEAGEGGRLGGDEAGDEQGEAADGGKGEAEGGRRESNLGSDGVIEWTGQRHLTHISYDSSDSATKL